MSIFIEHILYFTLIAIPAFIIFFYSHHTQSYWLIFTVLMLPQITLGYRYQSKVGLLLLVSSIIVLMVWLAGYMTGWVVWQSVYVFAIIFFTTTLGYYYQRLCLASFIINVFAIFALSLPLSSVDNIARIGFIAAGTGIVLCCHIVTTWPFAMRALRLSVTQAIASFAALSNQVFMCFLQQDYQEAIYLFEARLHYKKLRFLQAQDKIRFCTHVSRKHRAIIAKLLANFARLHDIMLDCAQLRYRVSDQTVFQICDNELSMIATSLHTLLSRMVTTRRCLAAQQNQLTDDSDAFAASITQLEDNYYHVLQVAAHEPLGFLLFIHSLKALQQEIIVLQGIAVHLICGT